MQLNQHLEQDYQRLLETVDRWFSRCLAAGGSKLACRGGCSACCRGLFDIPLLDAFLLKRAFAGLPESIREEVLFRCRLRLPQLQQRWPGLVNPFLLNSWPEQEWTDMPEDDETPCPLLDERGLCLVYAARPMVCRLHGLPNIDASGDDFDGTVCTLHKGDPLSLPGQILQADFRELFAREADLLRRFARELTGHASTALDTFIPLALLADYDSPDWRRAEHWSERSASDPAG